jgi:hypothetical protein
LVHDCPTQIPATPSFTPDPQSPISAAGTGALCAGLAPARAFPFSIGGIDMPRHLGDTLKRWEKTEAKKKLKALDKKSAQLSYADANYVINA